jgi:hypothetical protein
MNELEQRINRAATKAAAEVTTADIPPLRLSRNGRRSSGRRTASPHPMQWSGTGRGTKRILAPLAAAVSVVTLIVVMVTVGHGSPGTSHGPRPVTPIRPSAADRVLGAQALDWYFPASGASYTAGLAFSYAKEKATAHDVDPCLTKAGFPQPAFRGSKRLYQLSFPNNSQFPDLAQLTANVAQHYFTKRYAVLRHPTPARERAFAYAQARCLFRYAKPVTRVDRAASALQASWLAIISAIEHSRPVITAQRAFAKCLESHGVPAGLATRTDNAASNPLFYGYFSWADSTNQVTSSASQLAAAERHETRVFVSCAPSVVSVLDKLQVERRAQFFHRHAAQIARIIRLAREMPRRTH